MRSRLSISLPALFITRLRCHPERGFCFAISEAKPQSKDPCLHRRSVPGTFEPFPRARLCPLWSKLFGRRPELPGTSHSLPHGPPLNPPLVQLALKNSLHVN